MQLWLEIQQLLETILEMIKPLTSIRMLFAVFVFLSHLSFLDNSNTYSKMFNNIFSEGFLGVSFFFILSGFILTYNYDSRFSKKSISKKSFYIARFARIYPMHFVTMIIAFILSFIVGNNDNYLLQNSLLIQSFYNNKDIFFSLNAPSWSISDEMFFYMVFPFILFFNINIRVFILLILTAVILYLNIYLDYDSQHYWLYISPIFRFADFLLGVILYSIYKYTRVKFKNINGTILEVLSTFVFILFFAYHNYLDISYRYSIYYWLPMFLIILAFAVSGSSEKEGFFSKILCNNYLVWLGEISFCFYLLHLIVIRVISFIMNKIFTDIDLIILSLICLIVTLIASAFAYKFIEKPLNYKIKEYLL